MDEALYIAYFENLCRQSKDINHEVDGKQSFFYIDNPNRTDELNTAFRSKLQYPAFILDAPMGSLDNSGAASYNDSPAGAFSIVTKAKPSEIRAARAACKEIGIRFLARMNKDSREGQIIPGKTVHFRIEDVAYDTYNLYGFDVYGYIFEFRLVCPFGFSVDAGIWRDI